MLNFDTRRGGTVDKATAACQQSKLTVRVARHTDTPSAFDPHIANFLKRVRGSASCFRADGQCRLVSHGVCVYIYIVYVDQEESWMNNILDKETESAGIDDATGCSLQVTCSEQAEYSDNSFYD